VRCFTSPLRLVAVALFLILPEWVAAGTISSSAAESLLSQPSDKSWSLEAMVAAHHHAESAPQPATNEAETGISNLKQPGKRKEQPVTDLILQQRINRLSSQHKTDVETIKQLNKRLEDALAQASNHPAAVASSHPAVAESAQVKNPSSSESPEVTALQDALQQSQQQVARLNGQISDLNTVLKQREDKLQLLTAADVKQRQQQQQNIKALEQKLSERDREQLVLKQNLAKNQVELIHKNNALTGSQNTVTELLNSLKQQEQAASELEQALNCRSDELKQAAITLAELREKMQQQNTPDLKSAANRQAYIAGVMMAKGLHARLDDWRDAGIDIDNVTFQAGIKDGLSTAVRLKPKEAGRAQADFVKAVQVAVAQKVMQGERKIRSLATGRKPLKSANGIVWYRVRNGKAVSAGQPVMLSMTEEVVDGTVISRVPPMILRADDDMPAIVKDGMRLPGEGGEVVAYALAKTVYGEHPLPPGVRPYTVMEYHLRGEKLPQHSV